MKWNGTFVLYSRICCCLVLLYIHALLVVYDALPYFVDDLFSGVILCKFLMFRRLDVSGRTGYLLYVYIRIHYSLPYICLDMPK